MKALESFSNVSLKPLIRAIHNLFIKYFERVNLATTYGVKKQVLFLYLDLKLLFSSISVLMHVLMF